MNWQACLLPESLSLCTAHHENRWGLLMPSFPHKWDTCSKTWPQKTQFSFNPSVLVFITKKKLEIRNICLFDEASSCPAFPWNFKDDVKQFPSSHWELFILLKHASQSTLPTYLQCLRFGLSCVLSCGSLGIGAPRSAEGHRAVIWFPSRPGALPTQLQKGDLEPADL